MFSGLQNFLRSRLSTRTNSGLQRPIFDITPDLIQRLSHEMRTSLTSIVGYAEFIEEGTEPAMVNFTAKIIRESSQDLVRTVQAFVDLYPSSNDSGDSRYDEFSPAHLVHRLIQSSQGHADQLNVSLIFVCADEAQLVTMRSHAANFEKMLRAILCGALNAATRGAMVVVTLRVLAKERTVEIVLEELGGVAKMRQSQRMAQFWNTPRYVFQMQEGPGVELALAKALVARLHGQALFQSAKGQGDRLRLHLPINLPMSHDLRPT